MKLIWQSKLVLLLVMPFAGASLVLQAHWWAVNCWPVAVWTLGLSLLFGLVVLQLGAATPAAAFAGMAIAACLMFFTVNFTPAEAIPYAPWHTALVPVLTVFLLAYLATRLGREGKERLGVAAIVSSEPVQSWLIGFGWFSRAAVAPMPLFAVGLAALAEAAADTVSSEVGQVLGGRPRMLTTLRLVEPGTDGGVSLIGTLAGVAAAVLVAIAGSLALGGGRTIFCISCAGAVFGLFFDSLLGATLERRGWLNNDAVNFLSTASAAGFALGVMAIY